VFVDGFLDSNSWVFHLHLPPTVPPVVQLEILEPTSHTVIESPNTPSTLTASILSLRCVTIQGNPSTLTQVKWYRNGLHFLTSISLKQLQQSQSQSHAFYRVGNGKHFTLLDENTPIGPINGAVLRFNDSREPLVQYLESPDILTITNVSRNHAGNYSCLGLNGAANSSNRSGEKKVEVKCKWGRNRAFGLK